MPDCICRGSAGDLNQQPASPLCTVSMLYVTHGLSDTARTCKLAMGKKDALAANEQEVSTRHAHLGNLNQFSTFMVVGFNCCKHNCGITRADMHAEENSTAWASLIRDQSLKPHPSNTPPTPNDFWV